MEVLQAGREHPKIEIQCKHCGGRYKADKRNFKITPVWNLSGSVCALVSAPCRHCFESILLDGDQAHELGVTRSIVQDIMDEIAAAQGTKGRRPLSVHVSNAILFE